MSSALLFWRDYKSVKGSKTGYRCLARFEIQCKVTIKTDSFTKAVLERYMNKAKILEPKKEKMLGLFLLKESLNCLKETCASECQYGTLSLMYHVSKDMKRYFEASSIIKYDKDKGNKYIYNIYEYMKYMQTMQTLEKLNKQNTFILPPPSKMKFFRTVRISIFLFISKYYKITASNELLSYLNFLGQENKITLSVSAKNCATHKN